MLLKPITTEKAVKIIELDNTLIFKVSRKEKKETIKKELELQFNVKVEKIRSLLRNNQKYVYVRLKKENKAIDLATKLGMM